MSPIDLRQRLLTLARSLLAAGRLLWNTLCWTVTGIALLLGSATLLFLWWIASTAARDASGASKVLLLILGTIIGSVLTAMAIAGVSALAYRKPVVRRALGERSARELKFAVVVLAVWIAVTMLFVAVGG